MDVLNLALLGLFTFVILEIAFLTFTNDPKKIVNRLFAALSVLLAIWLTANQLSNSLLNYDFVLFLNKLIFGSTSLFVLVLLLFSMTFPDKNKIPIKILLIYLIPSVAVLVLSFGNFIVKDIVIKTGQSDVIFGNLFFLYGIQLISYVLISFFLLIKKLIKAKGEQKTQVKLLFTGFVIFIVLVLFTNLAIPFIFNNFSLTTYGSYSVIFLLAFTAYAIVKHHLMDVRIILTEAATSIVAIAIIIQIAVSKSTVTTVVNSIVLVLVIYGGYLLARSVKNEITRREEVERLAKKLDLANQKLEELDELKDNFMSMAAHELNTPIAAIAGYLSMIVEEKMCGKLNDKAMSYLKNVYFSSKRLAALVRDLLNVSRIESNRVHLVNTEVQMEDLINQAISEVKIKADEVGHKLTFEKPSAPLPKTWLDAPRIVEVMINIIGNAIKYTEPPNGVITVSAHTDGDKIVVAIKDNGRGIPKDRQDHIFEKFAQVDVAKDQVKGTGLGMFITKNLIDLHKGKVWFKSSVDPKDHGTTFFFSLPILKEKPFDEHEGEGAVLTFNK